MNGITPKPIPVVIHFLVPSATFNKLNSNVYKGLNLKSDKDLKKKLSLKINEYQ